VVIYLTIDILIYVVTAIDWNYEEIILLAVMAHLTIVILIYVVTVDRHYEEIILLAVMVHLTIHILIYVAMEE